MKVISSKESDGFLFSNSNQSSTTSSKEIEDNGIVLADNLSAEPLKMQLFEVAVPESQEELMLYQRTDLELHCCR